MVCVFGAPNPDNEYLLFEPLWAESEGPGNLIEEAKKIGLNMLVEAVNAAGLGEQVMDSEYRVGGGWDRLDCGGSLSIGSGRCGSCLRNSIC